MSRNGGAVFSLCLAALAAYAIWATRAWPMKAALFPLVMAIPLLVLALAQLAIELLGARDTTPPADAPPAIANRRTVAIFAWMAGFVVLVLLIGFPLTVPLWVFLHLFFAGETGWMRAILLAGAAWAAFYGLFDRLLRFPFEPGLVQTWLGA